MFSDSVTKRLIKIQNEQRAQKAAAVVNYGQLVKPSSIPASSWSGHVGNGDSPAARWIARFTRTDGVSIPPLVDFCWDYSLAKWNYDDLIAWSSITSVSGRDRHAVDEVRWAEHIYGIGSNYVEWAIEITDLSYSSSDGTNVTLNVEAVSTVIGSLVLTRVV